MRKTLAEIAKLVDGEVVGDGKLVITGLQGIKEAGKGDLTFVENPKYIPLLAKTKASAVLTSRTLEVKDKTVIRTDNPSLAFARVASLLSTDNAPHIKGIHKTAIIDDSARIGKNVTIGPYTVIEDNVKIGDKTVIHSGCFIGHHTTIGKDSLIYPRVTIRESISIGNRVIIHSGTVVGSDGFGYVSVKGVHEKIPQLGTVTIEDDVEIGANVTIDRARFDKTFIGRGTKIDNLVQIAHNVTIGENCIIIAQVGISGSVIIEKNAILAGQAGVVGHLTIGEGAIITAQAGVTKSVPPNAKMWGWPARPYADAMKINACMQRLPEYVNTIRELKKRLDALESKLNQK